MNKMLLMAVALAVAGCAAKPLPVDLDLAQDKNFNAGIVTGACLSNEKLDLYASANPEQGHRIYDCKKDK